MRAEHSTKIYSCSNKPVLHPPVESPKYRSNAFLRTLKNNGVVASISRVGARLDNAAMDSFFTLLQKNVLDRNAGPPKTCA